MVRLLGIICGVVLGWRYATGRDHTFAIGIVAALVLSLGHLMIALREWKARPGRVQREAIEKAFASPDPGEVEQVLADLDEMRTAGRPTARIICRYLVVAALLNALTLSVAGGITAVLSTLVAGRR